MLLSRGPPPSFRRGAVTHAEREQGSSSISVGSGEQKQRMASGCCLWMGQWRGFGLLEKDVGLKRRDGECALCSFCEDHIVMQGKKS